MHLHLVYDSRIERDYAEFIFWERIMRGQHQHERDVPVLYPFELAKVNGHLKQYIEDAFEHPMLTVPVANTFSL